MQKRCNDYLAVLERSGADSESPHCYQRLWPNAMLAHVLAHAAVEQIEELRIAQHLSMDVTNEEEFKLLGRLKKLHTLACYLSVDALSFQADAVGTLGKLPSLTALAMPAVNSEIITA